MKLRALLFVLPLFLLGTNLDLYLRVDISGGGEITNCDCPESGTVQGCFATGLAVTSQQGTANSVVFGELDGSSTYRCGRLAPDQRYWVERKASGFRLQSKNSDGVAYSSVRWMADPISGPKDSSPRINNIDGRGAGADSYTLGTALPTTLTGPYPQSVVLAFLKPNTTEHNEYCCAADGSRSSIEAMAAFTVVDTAASVDSDNDGRTDDEFDRGYYGAAAVKPSAHHVGQLNLATWPALSRAALTVAPPDIPGCRAFFGEPYGFAFVYENRQDEEVPGHSAWHDSNRSSFGADYAREQERCLMALMLDDSDATRIGDTATIGVAAGTRSVGAQALINYVQRGLDLYAMFKAGRDWAQGPSHVGNIGFGGMWHGKKLIAVTAARLLRGYDTGLTSFAQGANPSSGARIWLEDHGYWLADMDGGGSGTTEQVLWGYVINNCASTGDDPNNNCAQTGIFCRPRGTELVHPYDSVCGASPCGNWQYPFYHMNEAVTTAAIVYNLGAEYEWNNDLYLRFATERKRSTGYPVKAECGIDNEDGDDGIYSGGYGANPMTPDFWDTFCEGNRAPICNAPQDLDAQDCSNRGTVTGCTVNSLSLASSGGTEHLVIFDTYGGSNAYRTGVYANGDYWVEAKGAPLGARFLSRLPAENWGGNRDGWMTNPPSFQTNHLDGRKADNYTDGVSLPQTFQGPFPISFISVASRSTPDPVGTFCDKLDGANRSCLGSAKVITIVESADSVDTDNDGRTDDEMRPAYYLAAGNKPGPYRVDQFNMTGWPSLDPALMAGEPDLGWCAQHLRDPYGFAFMQTNFQDQEIPEHSSMAPKSYGADNNRDHTACLIAMLLSNANIATINNNYGSRSNGAQALVNYVQRGIDLYAMFLAGKNWAAGPGTAGGIGFGGHWLGKKIIMTVAGHLLRAVDTGLVNAAGGKNPAPGARIHTEDFLYYPSPNASENGKIYYGLPSTFNFCTEGFTDPCSSDRYSPFCAPKGAEGSWPGNCTGNSGPYDSACGACVWPNCEYPFYYLNAMSGWAFAVYWIGAESTFNNNNLLKAATDRRRATGFPLRLDCGLCNEDTDNGKTAGLVPNPIAEAAWNAYCEPNVAQCDAP